jgi:hypothetical protein
MFFSANWKSRAWSARERNLGTGGESTAGKTPRKWRFCSRKSSNYIMGEGLIFMAVFSMSRHTFGIVSA